MAKPSYKRSARVGDQMKQEIADILMKKIKDPRIGFVTVTDVEISDDLRNAKVFISTYGGSRTGLMDGLESAAAYIRGELGRRMRLKFVPEILFRYDEAAERGSHIMELLQGLEADRRREGEGPEDE